jgi:hypothetical protein
MVKIAIEDVESILRQIDTIPVTEANKVISELNRLVAAKDEEPKVPREKKQEVVLLSDPNKDYRDVSIVGWVVKIPESDPFVTVPEKIQAAANDFNVTPKGRRMPVRTVGESLEAIPARIFKEHGISVLTKEPVSFLPVDNCLKKDVVDD